MSFTAVSPLDAEGCVLDVQVDGSASVATCIVDGAVACRLSSATGTVWTLACAPGRELVAACTKDDCTVYSALTGKVVSRLPVGASGRLALGARHAAWQTAGGVAAVDLLHPTFIHVLHACTGPCSFVVGERDCLHVVEDAMPNKLHTFCLRTHNFGRQWTRVPKCIAEDEPANRACSRLTSVGASVAWLTASDEGVVVHARDVDESHTAVSLLRLKHMLHTIELGAAHAVVLRGKLTVAYSTRNIEDEARHFLVRAAEGEATVETEHECPCSIATNRAQTRTIVSSGGVIVAPHGHGPSASERVVLIKPVFVPLDMATRRAMKICKRCRVRCHPHDFGVKYCTACATPGTPRRMFGKALEYAFNKYKWRPTPSEWRILRRQVWDHPPRCWLTGVRSSEKVPLAFAKIYADKRMSMANLMIISVSHVRAEMSHMRKEALAARLRGCLL